MTKITRCLSSIAAVAALVTGVIWQTRAAQATNAPPAKHAAPSDPAEIEGIIFERQQLMTQLDEESKTLGEVIAGTAPREKMAPSARAIANLAKETLEAFEPQAPGGRSKPEIWTNWEDYSSRMQSFAEKSDEMAKQAEAGNIDAVTGLMSDALPCKQCHDVYRLPKKPPAG